MPSNTCAYFFKRFKNMELISTIAQADIDTLKKNGHYPNYFIKLYSSATKSLEKFFIKNKEEARKLPCPWHYYIL